MTPDEKDSASTRNAWVMKMKYPHSICWILQVLLLVLSSCSDDEAIMCERCAKDPKLQHLRVLGAMGRKVDHIQWRTAAIDCPGASRRLADRVASTGEREPLGAGVNFAVLEKKIVDDRGNLYDLVIAGMLAVPNYATGRQGYEGEFHIRDERLKGAREVSLDIVFSADGQKYHIKDRVVRSNSKRYVWESESWVRAREKRRQSERKTR